MPGYREAIGNKMDQKERGYDRKAAPMMMMMSIIVMQMMMTMTDRRIRNVATDNQETVNKSHTGA